MSAKEKEIKQEESITEEVINEKEVIEEQETQEETPIESNPIEELASEMGWIPKDKFKGEPEEWEDAHVFLKNANLIAKKQHITIERLTNDIGNLKTDVRKTLDYQKKLSQKQIDELKSQLLEQKREAIRDADVDTVEKIDAKIKSIDEESEEDDTSVNEYDPVFDEWHEKNKWYGTDKRKTRYADAVAKEYENSNIKLEEILNIVDSEMELFKKTKDTEETKGTENKTKKVSGTKTTDVIDETHRSIKTTEKYKHSDIPYDLQKIAKDMVRQKIIKTEKEYYDDYFSEIDRLKGV